MQDNLFAKLPIALIKCGLLAELKSSSVVVYNVLLSYADFNTGKCFPGIKTICTFSGLTKPTVIDAIKELEDWGLVEVTRRHGSHNIYQLKYWWGSEATGTKNLTSGVKNFNHSGQIFDTLTRDNTENQIKKPNVVNRRSQSNISDSSGAKKLVYQLRIADIQQQQAWADAIQELFKGLFHRELPAELIDEKFAQGIKAQFILEILKNLYDPGKIRNPIGWFRSLDEDWSF